MSYSDYSPPESPYYDDDDDERYHQSDDYFGDLVHVGRVRKEFKLRVEFRTREGIRR